MFVPNVGESIKSTVTEFVPAMVPLRPELAHEPRMAAGVVGTALPTTEADGDLNRRIYLWTGDITRLAVTAIVVPAPLVGAPFPGGLARDVRKVAGPEVDEAFTAAMKGKLPLVGAVIVTPSGLLPAKWVAHVTLPTKAETADSSVAVRYVQGCYQNALAAVQKVEAMQPPSELRTVAFCCLGTGHYSCELDETLAAHCALSRFVHRTRNMKRMTTTGARLKACYSAKNTYTLVNTFSCSKCACMVRRARKGGKSGGGFLRTRCPSTGDLRAVSEKLFPRTNPYKPTWLVGCAADDNLKDAVYGSLEHSLWVVSSLSNKTKKAARILSARRRKVSYGT